MFNRLLNSPVFAATVMGLLVGGLLSVFLIAKIVSEVMNWGNTNGEYPNKTITVTGEGEELAVPDITTFDFTVTEKGNTMEEAQSKASKKINEAIEFLKNSKVDEKDIKTGSYNSYPVYNYSRPCSAFDCPPASNEIDGYESSQSVSVKVRQSDEAGRFVTELGRIGISNISSLYFEVDDEDALNDKAKQKAIEDAKTKATQLANSLGVKLGSIISFGEEQQYPMFENRMMSAVSSKDVAMPEIAPELPKGENTYTARVWITYEIK